MGFAPYITRVRFMASREALGSPHKEWVPPNVSRDAAHLRVTQATYPEGDSSKEKRKTPMKRYIETHDLDWNGLKLTVTREYDHLMSNLTGEDHVIIKARSVCPANAPLPIAKNGFYDHSLPASIISAAGGPANYIDVMLEAETMMAA